MVMVTNRAKGPRLFHETDKTQPTVLYPGESRDLNLVTRNDVVLKAWEEAGEIEFGKAAAEAETKRPEAPLGKAPAELEKLTDEELRVYITERGGKFDGRWKRDRLLDEARGVPAQG